MSRDSLPPCFEGQNECFCFRLKKKHTLEDIEKFVSEKSSSHSWDRWLELADLASQGMVYNFSDFQEKGKRKISCETSNEALSKQKRKKCVNLSKENPNEKCDNSSKEKPNEVEIHFGDDDDDEGEIISDHNLYHSTLLAAEPKLIDPIINLSNHVKKPVSLLTYDDLDSIAHPVVLWNGKGFKWKQFKNPWSINHYIQRRVLGCNVHAGNNPELLAHYLHMREQQQINSGISMRLNASFAGSKDIPFQMWRPL
jgi:hypothetical protein